MTPRENLLKLLRREGYDYIPCEFSLCPSLLEQYNTNEKSSLEYQAYFNFPWRNAPSLEDSNHDLTRFYKYHDVIDENVSISQWGIGHRKTPTSMHMTQMLYPLAKANSIEEIQEYPMPDYRPQDNTHVKAEIEKIKESGLAAVGNMQCTIWETSWYLRGMENLMADMMMEDPIAQCLFDRVEERALAKAEIYARGGVDILFLGDDIGMQFTPMMSQELYCRWIKPALARVIKAAKAINPSVIILYHSCGFVEPFIPHLIEAGIDVLNPVQPECMDFEKIYRLYGDRLSFHGTLGTQSTMPFGTPEEVRATVKRNLDIAGKKGGLWVVPTHLLEPEVPWENVLAYAEACREYRL